eukprot:COSAG05_NODE_24410_length_251_cov_1.348684_1_plen_83_part_11
MKSSRDKNAQLITLIVPFDQRVCAVKQSKKQFKELVYDITERAAGMYRVVKRCTVRTQFALDSKKTGHLDVGEKMTVIRSKHN